MNEIYSSNAFSLFLSSVQVNQKISVFASSDILQAENVTPTRQSATSENMRQTSDAPASVAQPAIAQPAAAPSAASTPSTMGTSGGGY